LSRRTALARGLLGALLSTACLPLGAQEPAGGAEPNTRVPAGVARYAPDVFPERIVASPAQDAATGLAMSWRTDATVEAPWLEIVVAGDSPDMGPPRRVRASTRALQTENGLAHYHRADVDGLQPDTLYAWRVQGGGTWSAWHHTRTAAAPGAPLTLLYFGDTQNKNVSHVTRVVREAMRRAPEARLALFAGDLVSGGDGEDDNEWGEWFEAMGALPTSMAVAPAAGNHEYTEFFEDTPKEYEELGVHWPATFALPRNGVAQAPDTTYWFDYQDVRVAVLDGTAALEKGAAAAQARWLDRVLSGGDRRWRIVLLHQPFHSAARGKDNAALLQHLMPVVRRHRVDLVLQGHDHVYGRRTAGGDGVPPVLTVSVAGPKQYRLSARARDTMRPVGEDTQLFQVLRIDGGRLRYEAFTATGRLYDAFELVDEGGARRLVEIEDGRIPERDCTARAQSPKGRADRCWE